MAVLQLVFKCNSLKTYQEPKQFLLYSLRSMHYENLAFAEKLT